MMRYAAIACFAAIAAAAPAELPLYATSFETSEGYTTGASIDNVNGWRVINGAVTVESGAGAMESGAFVQLGTGGILDRGFTNTAGANVVWVEGYFKGAGSSVRLADAT